MVVSEKHQYELETERRNCVISSAVKTTRLRAITTNGKNPKPRQQVKEREITRRINNMCIVQATEQQENGDNIEEDEEEGCTTPTGRDAKISERLMVCPPAPRKQKSKPSSTCTFDMRDVFYPPDLESVFIRRS